MRHKSFRYIAKLVCSKKAENHIQNLLSSPSFKITTFTDTEDERIIYEVDGPLTSDQHKNLEDINSDLSN